MRVGEQQLVTGIVVNEKLQVSKKKRNFIRQQMHYIEKFGLEEHLKARKITRANYVQHLLGQVNFVLYIHEEDPEFLRYKAVLEKMA
jgi:RNA-directed DNA polymerase